MAVAFRATGGAGGSTTGAAAGTVAGLEGSVLAAAGGIGAGEGRAETGAGTRTGTGRLGGVEGTTGANPRTGGVETPPAAPRGLVGDDAAGKARGDTGGAILLAAGGGTVRGTGATDVAGAAGRAGAGDGRGAAAGGVTGKDAAGGAAFRLRVNSLPLGERCVGGVWASADVAEKRATIEQAAIFMSASSRLTFSTARNLIGQPARHFCRPARDKSIVCNRIRVPAARSRTLLPRRGGKSPRYCHPSTRPSAWPGRGQSRGLRPQCAQARAG